MRLYILKQEQIHRKVDPADNFFVLEAPFSQSGGAKSAFDSATDP